MNIVYLNLSDFAGFAPCAPSIVDHGLQFEERRFKVHGLAEEGEIVVLFYHRSAASKVGSGATCLGQLTERQQERQ